MRNLLLRSGSTLLPFLVITLIIVCGDYCVEMISLQHPQHRDRLEIVQTVFALAVCVLFLSFNRAPAREEH